MQEYVILIRYSIAEVRIGICLNSNTTNLSNVEIGAVDMKEAGRIWIVLSRVFIVVLMFISLCNLANVISGNYFLISLKSYVFSFVVCVIIHVLLMTLMAFSKDEFFNVISVAMFFVWILLWQVIFNNSLAFLPEHVATITLAIVSIAYLIICVIKNSSTVLRILSVIQFLIIIGVFCLIAVIGNGEVLQVVEKEEPSVSGKYSVRTEIYESFDRYFAHVYVHPNYIIDCGLFLIRPQGSFVYSSISKDDPIEITWENDCSLMINDVRYIRKNDTTQFVSTNNE